MNFLMTVCTIGSVVSTGLDLVTILLSAMGGMLMLLLTMVSWVGSSLINKVNKLDEKVSDQYTKMSERMAKQEERTERIMQDQEELRRGHEDLRKNVDREMASFQRELERLRK